MVTEHRPLVCFHFLVSCPNVLFSLLWCMFLWQYPLFQGTSTSLPNYIFLSRYFFNLLIF